MPSDAPLAAYVALSLFLLLWDVFLAGQIAQLRSAPRPFAAVTALAGLLLAPALLIAGASASILNGRAIHTIGWVWPLAAVLFAVQAVYATVRGLVTPLIGLPIMLFDVVLAIAAVSGYVVDRGADPPQAMLAVAAAHASALGYALGPAALVSPWALQVPLLAPAYPARWRVSKTVRAAVAAVAVAGVAAVLAELPRSVMAIRSYEQFADAPLRERPAGDFAVALKIFPDLDGAPPPLALRHDLALVDSTGVKGVMVVVDGDAARGADLDSLAHALEEMRRDTVPLIVALDYAGDARERYRAAPDRYLAQRLATVEQVVRRLRPDYLIPAHEPYGRGARALGSLPLQVWTRHLTEAARLAHRIRPRTRVGVLASAYDSRDSALYRWAVRPGSPLDVVGFTIVPSFRGGRGVQARTQAADRWLRAAGATRKEHWVVAAGYPGRHGEVSQERALWGAAAWATAQPPVKGMVVIEAGDYDTDAGLRVPGGRLRFAVRAVTRTVRGLRESAAEAVPATADAAVTEPLITER